MSAHRHDVGDKVDVHTNFSDTWVGGFEIAGLMAGGYRLRRDSDGSLLPGPTSEGDLRARCRTDEAKSTGRMIGW